VTALNIVDLPPPPRSVPRDGHDRPMIVPKAGGKAVAHTRTTTYVDCLEDKTSLATWGKRMVLVGAAKHPNLLDGVLSLDPEDPGDKRELDAKAERLFELSGANGKRDKGTYLHKLSEYVDEGTPLPEGISQADFLDMGAYMMATVNMKVLHSEQIVTVNELCTAGTPDRVSEYDGLGPDGKFLNDNLITDLKTGNVEYGGLKMAAQLAVYSRGLIYDHTVFPEVDTKDKKAWAEWKKTEWDAELAATAYSPLPNVNQDWGIIINLRPGSAVATLYWVDLRIGWEAAVMAKSIRALRSKSGKALIPFA
jgi:hypothetical protein